MLTRSRLPSSFRDPSGFVFSEEGEIFRQVNHVYREHYDEMVGSGLYQALLSSGTLISHEEVPTNLSYAPNAYKILRPEKIPFISYPYEWSFHQLKDAALTTLEVQKQALQYGLTLKDASAYNVQFLKGRPVFIDLLSFEKYQEGQPWVAYRQFCQHFLAPLALMNYNDVGFGLLSKVHLDGIPLELAQKLLPKRTLLKPALLMHIHLHARFQKKAEDRPELKQSPRGKFTRNAFQGLVDSLESAVRSLDWKGGDTEWADYENAGSYDEVALGHKTGLVDAFLNRVAPDTVWDLGGNTGRYSRLAANMGAYTVSFDKDPSAVDGNYLSSIANKETKILPLLLDLSNPSPKIGWASDERMDLYERGPADLIMALALIHHLAISGNVPLGMIAEFFSRLGQWAVVEFVPKTDKQVARLLATRRDDFPNYTEAGFEHEFSRFFRIESKQQISGSERLLYLLQKR